MKNVGSTFPSIKSFRTWRILPSQSEIVDYKSATICLSGAFFERFEPAKLQDLTLWNDDFS